MRFRQSIQSSPTPPNDFTLEDHGSIVLMWTNTIAASAWLIETAPEDAQFFGAALAIEPRYVGNVAEAVVADGFTISER